MKKNVRRYSLMSLVLALLMAISPLAALAEATAAPEATQTAPVTEAAETETSPEATPESEQEPVNFFAQLELFDIYGEPFDTSVFNGKPAFINIWATWCNPCVVEMPHLEELAKEYADKITIVGIHSEGMTVEDGELVPWEEKNEAARALAQRLGLTFPLLNPDSNLFVLMNVPDYGLQVFSLPSTWLVDENGSVKSVIPGSRDKEAWQEIIDDFLKYLEGETVEQTEG